MRSECQIHSTSVIKIAGGGAFERAPWNARLEGGSGGKSAGGPAGCHLFRAAGRARSAHIVQFRPVGVERPGKECAEEGPDPGEEIAMSIAAVCRGVE